MLEMTEGENEWTKSTRKQIDYVGDEKNIRQMISLLLDNAMKYSSEHGTIRITLKNSGKNKIITVWNTTDQIEKGKSILFTVTL